jgi:hypothetical protein
MRFVEVVVVFLVAFLGMATTFVNIASFSTCAVENNMFLRGICYAYGYNAVWMWLPLEFGVLLLVYYCLKKLRTVLSSRIKVGIPPIAEILFLVLVSIPALNNVLVFLYRVSLGDLFAVP